MLPTPTSTLEHPTNMKNDQPNSNLRSFTTLRGTTGMLAVAGLLAMIHAGCDVEPDRGIMSEQQREELSAHGIDDVVDDGDALILIAPTGDRIGTVSQQGPTVEVQLADELAQLHRSGTDLIVQCMGFEAAMVIDSPSQLEGWILDTELDAECARALEVGRIITEIDRLHADGCEVEDGEDGDRLACAEATDEEEMSFRNLASGCECAGDDWGSCPAECWSCSYDAFAMECDVDVGGGGGGGGGEGGGGGGGGELGCGAYNKVFVEIGNSQISEAFARQTAETKAANKCMASNGWICHPSVSYVSTSCSWMGGVYGWECGAYAYCTYSPW